MEYQQKCVIPGVYTNNLVPLETVLPEVHQQIILIKA